MNQTTNLNSGVNPNASNEIAPEMAQIETAPFCLLRLATLPFTALEKLHIEGIEQRLQSIISAEDTMAELSEAIANALHLLVPQIAEDDNKFRRSVLNLKRDIHNCRTTKSKPAEVDKIAQHLTEDEAKKLHQWYQAQAIVKQFPEYEKQLADALQTQLRPGLRAALKVKEYRRALAFASSGVAREAKSEKKLPKVSAPNNLERSLLGYLNRSTAKTSPFSSFMALAVVPLTPQENGATPSAKERDFLSHVTFNRGAVSRYFRSIVESQIDSDAFLLNVNPTLKEGVGGKLLALSDREVVLLGRPWLEQRFAQFRLNSRVVETLNKFSTPQPYSQWLQSFAEQGIEGDAAKNLILKLFERDVLQVKPVLDAYHDPLKALFDAWSNAELPAQKQVASQLSTMADHVRTIETAETSERLTAFNALAELDQDILNSTAAGQKMETLQNLVLEDCWLENADGQLGANLLSALPDLNRFLASQLIISPYYERMCEHFISLYGEDGTCTDVVKFLLTASEKIIDIPEFGDKFTIPDTNRPKKGEKLPVTAQVQIARCPKTGKSSLIVNKVFEGEAWLAARFTAGEHASQKNLAGHLRQWVTDIHAPHEPVDLVIGGHCNDLQAHARITDRVIKWPGESLQVPEEQIINASELTISFNKARGLLEVFDGSGKQIKLVYMGATYPSPLWGLRYALSILTQPYLLQRPDFKPPEFGSHQDFTYEPRLVEGKLVLRRATWWVSARYLRENWFEGESLRQLVNVQRDRDRLNVPRYVYVQKYIPPQTTGLISQDVLDPSRKPIWIDLANPFWLNMLERLVEKSDWLSFTEPFPNNDELWLTVDGEPHVSEIQLEMLVAAP